MSTDTYTRIVLTVIAICLIWLCIGPLLHPPTASAQSGPQDVRIVGLGGDFVQYIGNPDGTTTVQYSALPVRVVKP
jgi:hypothetical protein